MWGLALVASSPWGAHGYCSSGTRGLVPVCCIDVVLSFLLYYAAAARSRPTPSPSITLFPPPTATPHALRSRVNAESGRTKENSMTHGSRARRPQCGWG